jgi:hypothetical protein
MKKCPSGVICIENYSLFFIIICVILIFYLIYNSITNQNITVNNKSTEKIIIKDYQRENSGWVDKLIPSWNYTNLQSDPYAPPLRDERYFIRGIPPGAIPINISTNVGSVDTTYRQLGILSPSNSSSKDSIIPLFGRPLFTNRDKWQYYSTSNQHNNIKLPISRAGKSCTNEYGCDKLYNGDTVYIEGSNEIYKVTTYDNDTIKYLPFI